MTTHHPIAIIGGGLGGLTLARVLHVNGVQAVVFDLDASPSARTQGGMLDIHVESGQAALRAAGLHDEFRAIVHPGGEAVRILDRHAVVHHEESDEGDGGRPEVARGDLRDLLLRSLPEGTVRWGAKVAACSPARRRQARSRPRRRDGVHHGPADRCRRRVVEGPAPGVHRRTGLRGRLLRRSASERRRESPPGERGTRRRWHVLRARRGQGFLAHRDTTGSLHVYVALTTAENWISTLDFTDTAAAKTALLDHFDGWDAGLRALITDADGELTPRPIHALPIGHRWDRTPGVTLLGDAAHLMSPFAA